MFGMGKGYRNTRKHSPFIHFVVIMNGLYWRHSGMGGRWTNQLKEAEYFADVASADKIARAADGWVYSFNSLTGRILPVRL